MHLRLHEQQTLPDIFLDRVRESPTSLAYRQFVPDRPLPPGTADKLRTAARRCGVALPAALG